MKKHTVYKQYNNPPKPDLEGFVPTDYFPEEVSAKKKKGRFIRVFLLSLLAVILVALITTFFYWHRLSTKTSEYFQTEPTCTPVITPEPIDNAYPIEVTPAPDPFAGISNADNPDLSEMDNILNIALIGVDYAEERESWKGKEGLSGAHADVIIILAVNFDKNTADMISLPRDTYTIVPGVSGIYKLNGSLNAGGGLLAKNGAGFNKVCETASYLLGGIPVNYYYAVTMPAVKELVDAIGGVDYRLEMSFTMQGRHYTSGKHHLNGQAVLDYLRVRKESSGLEPGQTGDAHRVQRQKKMLLAILSQLKKTDTLLKIPEILDSFDGQLYTNCSLEQTSSLAAYATTMPSDNISMHSMVGSGGNFYSWNFSFIKQEERVKLIKKVYGIDVPTLPELTLKAANLEYETRIANRYLNTCGPLTTYVSSLLEEDEKLPKYGTGDEGTATRKYSDTNRAFFEKYLDALETLSKAREGNSVARINTARNKVKRLAIQCSNLFRYKGTLTWTVPLLADTNEVYVDFR